MSHLHRQRALDTKSDLFYKSENQLGVPLPVRPRRGSASNIGETVSRRVIEGTNSIVISPVSPSSRSRSSSDVSHRQWSRGTSLQHPNLPTPFSPTIDSASLWQRINSQAASTHQQNNLAAVVSDTRVASDRKQQNSWNVKPHDVVDHPYRLLRDRSLSAPEKDINYRQHLCDRVQQICQVSNARVKWSSCKRPAERKQLHRADTADYLRVRNAQIGRVWIEVYKLFVTQL